MFFFIYILVATNLTLKGIVAMNRSNIIENKK